MALLVSVALFGLLVAAITAYGYGRYAKPARLLQQLDTEGTAMVTLDRIGQPKQSTLARRVQAIGQHAPISPKDAQTTRRTLMAAGYRAESAVALLYGIKLILAVTLAILAIAFRGSITANPLLRIALPVAATVAGYWIPGFVLERKVTKRREKLRLSLPDGLDLMVVSVEAGLGLDQAIQNVGRELVVAHPELSEEVVAALHLSHRPVEGVGRSLWVDHYLREQVRQAVVLSELDALRVDEDKAYVVGRRTHQDRCDHRVDAR